MNHKILKATLAVALTICSGLASADFTYNVNLTAGDGTAGNPTTTVIGTITTDETLGSLVEANILDWSLQFSNGVSFALPHDTDQMNFFGSLLSATATTLNFNFSGPSGYVSFFGGDPVTFLCFSGTGLDSRNQCGAGFGPTGSLSVGLGVSSGDPTGLSTTSLAGEALPVVVATRSDTQTVPEPGSLALLGLGLAGLGLVRRKKV